MIFVHCTLQVWSCKFYWRYKHTSLFLVRFFYHYLLRRFSDLFYFTFFCFLRFPTDIQCLLIMFTSICVFVFLCFCVSVSMYATCLRMPIEARDCGPGSCGLLCVHVGKCSMVLWYFCHHFWLLRYLCYLTIMSFRVFM